MGTARLAFVLSFCIVAYTSRLHHIPSRIDTQEDKQQ